MVAGLSGIDVEALAERPWGKLSRVEKIAVMGPEAWKKLTTDQVQAILDRDWYMFGRPEQIAPEGDWFLWMILAGRGWGKTRTGAEWMAEKSKEADGFRGALVAPTYEDARLTMVEGESGLLSVLPPSRLLNGSVEDSWSRGYGELTLADGAMFKTGSAERADKLRGPQWHAAWCDEVAAWTDAPLGEDHESATWQILLAGIRLLSGWRIAPRPQVCVTTTPKTVKLIKQLWYGDSGLRTVRVQASSRDNLSNLAPAFVDSVIRPRLGTRLGRQEIDAMLLEDLGDIFDVSKLLYAPAETIADPYYMRTVDLASTEPHERNLDPDWTATLLAGVDLTEQRVDVIGGDRCRKRPGDRNAWLERIAVEDAEMFDGDIRWWVEADADQFEHVQRAVSPHVTVRRQTPIKNKVLRAEGPSAAVDQGRVTIVTRWTRIAEFVDELRDFSDDDSHPHDDWVDCLSMVFSEAPFKRYAGIPVPRGERKGRLRSVS